MTQDKPRTKGFISYSHKDKKWLEQLRPYLDALARERAFAIWDDTRIKAGSEWRAEIESALLTAKVAILLVSQDFLNSDFISRNELPPLLDAAKADGAVVLPLILTPCRFSHHPNLSKFQSVNPPSKTLRQMSVVQRQLLFLQLTEIIEELLSTSADSTFESASPVSASSTPVFLSSTRARAKKSRQARPTKPSADAQEQPNAARPAGLWQRVAITSGADGTLRYQVRGIREDFVVQPNQRALIDRLVERCVQQRKFEPDMATTLFGLLVPTQLKPILFSTGRTELLLDTGSARFPWELLQDNASRAEPFAVRGSIIRRLSTNQLQMSRGGAGRALVIGDPVSNFPALLGVQKEASDVAMQLRNQGYNVTVQIRETAENAIAALLTQAHQVLHLAGNGVVDYLPGEATDSHDESASRTKVTGFILGNDIFFTCVEAAQMREVPELVFINACYMGHISDRDTSETTDTGDRNRFAASLGTQFLQSGVQAVVAPGWAISDAAAITFANAFYSAMLSGDCFGDATHAARKSTYERHPNDNTWGAYHCYGDPDYKLVSSTT